MNFGVIFWKTPLKIPRLHRSEVHVWKACLDQPRELLEHYWECLSGDERNRANRFASDLHRWRFVVGRAILRNLLGNYLRIQPEYIRLIQGIYGKPSLVNEQNPDQLRFNLSHANDLALFAFSTGREVGIDVEFISTIPDVNQVAAKYFAPDEYKTWASLPDSEKKIAFFQCWTRKEAFIKAVGDGFFYPLDQFEVAFTPGEQARLTRVDRDPLAIDRWSYADLPILPGYVAALIVEGNDWQPACYEAQGLFERTPELISSLVQPQ